jgi:hypothetical protein
MRKGEQNCVKTDKRLRRHFSHPVGMQRTA